MQQTKGNQRGWCQFHSCNHRTNHTCQELFVNVGDEACHCPVVAAPPCPFGFARHTLKAIIKLELHQEILHTCFELMSQPRPSQFPTTKTIKQSIQEITVIWYRVTIMLYAFQKCLEGCATLERAVVVIYNTGCV